MSVKRHVIIWSFVLMLAGSVPVSSQATAGAAVVSSLGSIGMTVSDMDRSVAFYRDVLDFKKVSEVEVDGPEYDRLWGLFGMRARVTRLQLGEQTLELIQFLAPPDVRAIPVPSYSNDLWFQHIAIVVHDMERAWAQLRKHHVRQISPRPQTIPISNPAAAGIKAIKFRDPDGHNLELLWFPEGKGDRWRAAETPPLPELFLGIDHTAMTVRSTEHSIKFYRDVGHDGRGRHGEHGARAATSRQPTRRPCASHRDETGDEPARLGISGVRAAGCRQAHSG